jgi:hypothetical protein
MMTQPHVPVRATSCLELYMALPIPGMASGTTHAAVDHLLAGFRHYPDELPTTPSHPSLAATMVAPGDSPPATTSQEVVRVQRPATQRETQSQVELVAKADAGDLQARLDLISIDAAKDALAKRFCKQQPGRSILDYLRAPGDGIEPYQAASTVLEELADRTEDSAYVSTLVFRYIQTYALWKGHPSPVVDSAEELVRRLNGSDYVQANVIIGTSAQVAKRNCIRLIDEKWAHGWFDKIPPNMCDRSWVSPEGCSKRLLTEMAANAKQGHSLQAAIEAWAKARDRRTNYAERRKYGIKSKTTPHIIPEDVATLNRIVRDEDRGRRTSDMFFPEEAKEDRLTVAVVAPTSAGKTAATWPSYAKGRDAAPGSKKRKRREAAERDESGEKEEWRESENGKWMVKRVGNLRVRKPMRTTPETVAEISETQSSQTPDPGRLPDPPPTQSSKPSSPRDPTPHASPRPLECEGPAFAAAISKLLGLLSELENPTYTTARCCDQCRRPLQQAVHSLQRFLPPVITDLEEISTHTFSNKEALSTQDYGISPYQPYKQRSSIVVPDSDTD